MPPEPTKVVASELLLAFEIASMGEGSGNQAFVSVNTGKTFIISDYMDPDADIPDDLETSSDFLRLPDKKELGLGRDLVFSFIEEKSPNDWDVVRAFFRRRGAYARFKDLLVTRGMLEEWHRYEETSTEEALRQWCEDNGLQMSPSDNQMGRESD